jgi:hypothetical protein
MKMKVKLSTVAMNCKRKDSMNVSVNDKYNKQAIMQRDGCEEKSLLCEKKRDYVTNCIIAQAV